MPASTYSKPHVKVADELFLTVALLTRERPDQESFSIPEILERAGQQGLGTHRADQNSLKQHAYEHAAANVPPGKGKYRLVFREQNNRVRLLRPDDPVHPARNGKQWPNEADIPEKYLELVEWAKRRYDAAPKENTRRWLHDLLALRGTGKEIWKKVDPDKYVSDLRSDWQ